MMTWFITIVVSLSIICIGYSVYLSFKSGSCFIHKWRIKRSYWSGTIYLREYECRKCKKEITTHYDI